MVKQSQLCGVSIWPAMGIVFLFHVETTTVDPIDHVATNQFPSN
jgi:hypothetical protein